MEKWKAVMDDMKQQIEERAAEIEQSADETKKTEKGKKKFDEIYTALQRNRVGDAHLYAEMFREKYVFVEEWERWLVWKGHHWEWDKRKKSALADVERVCALYHNLLESEDKIPDYVDYNYLKKTVNSRLNQLRTPKGRDDVLACATTSDYPMTVSSENLDQQHYLLATPTGEVDLRTGECHPGKQEHYLLNACPTPWEGLDAPCPNFANFLLTCMGDDQEMADFLVRLLGYGLLGEKHLHIWAIMYGPLSRNGKDTLMSVIKKILGSDLHTRIGVSLLLEQKFLKDSSRPEPDLMALRGAKIAYASEANSRHHLDQAKIKDLTGGGYITARGLNDKYMTEWRQSALIFLLTNYLPRLETDDDGFRARTVCIEWPVKFVPHPTKPWERQIDYDMAKTLEKEASGILALLVKGCMDVLANGLRIPEKVLQYTRDQIDLQDDIGRFLRECCEIEEPPTGGRDYTTRYAASSLLAICNWWCRKTLGNSYPFTPKKFTPALEKKGIPTRKSSIMYYMGVSIKPEILHEYEDDDQSGGGQ